MIPNPTASPISRPTATINATTTSSNMPYWWTRNNKNGQGTVEKDWVLILKEVDNTILPWYQDKGVLPTLRTAFYRLVSKNMLPNDKGSYQGLSEQMVKAKKGEFGFRFKTIKWGCFADEGRLTRQDYPYYNSPKDYFQDRFDRLKYAVKEYTIPRWYKQPNYVEVWLEKEALVSTFRKFLKGKEVNIRKLTGFNGWESANQTFHDMAKTMYYEGVFWPESRNIHILYFGDMDPSGEDIERAVREQIEYFSEKTISYNTKQNKSIDLSHITLTRIAVTWDQMIKYNLPSDPDQKTKDKLIGTSAKKGDARTEKYIKHHDGIFKVAELDAMLSYQPDSLERLLVDATDQYFDNDIYDKVQSQLKRKDHKQIRKMLKDNVRFLDNI